MPTIQSQGRSKAQTDAIIRVFGDGIPVVEATDPLRIFPLACDLTGAVRGDPARCVLAVAAERMGLKSLFLRSVAYVLIPDENGNPRLERFTLNPAARAAIRLFDRTGAFPLAGFVLVPPPLTSTLEYQRIKAFEFRLSMRVRGIKRTRQGPRTDALALEGVRWGSAPHITFKSS